MKRIFIFSICVSILTLSANGQSEALINSLTGGREAGVISLPTSMKKIDTIPKVKYVMKESDRRLPAVYIDGKFCDNVGNSTRLKTIDPMLLDSIHIEKEEIEVKGKKYYGQIFFKMKKDYNPKIISLTNLLKKYTNIKNGLTLFMIDNEYIKGDYNKCFVDEKYLLEIIVDNIEIEKEKQNINVIQLLTKSDANIEKSKEIRIGGFKKYVE